MDSNRVLTLDEVLALKPGAPVWVQAPTGCYYADGMHRRRTLQGHPILMDDFQRHWVVTERQCGHAYRVWAQPPTPDELAANPWMEVEV